MPGVMLDFQRRWEMAEISAENWSFLRSSLEGNSTPTLVASTLFGVMRQAGYTVAEIRTMGFYMQGHTGTDKASNTGR